MKKFLSVMLMSALLCISCVTSFAVNETKLTSADIQLIKENMAQLKIEKSTQVRLINKIQSGQLLDSMNPQKVKLAVVSKKTLSNGTSILRSVYPDGSVSETIIENLEKENSMLMARSSSSGTGYFSNTDVKISVRGITYGYGFFADFTYVHGSYDYISRIYDPFANCVGGSISINTPTIDRSQETAWAPAMATMSVQYDVAGGIAGSGTHIMKFEVSNDSYRVYEK